MCCGCHASTLCSYSTSVKKNIFKGSRVTAVTKNKLINKFRPFVRRFNKGKLFMALVTSKEYTSPQSRWVEPLTTAGTPLSELCDVLSVIKWRRT